MKKKLTLFGLIAVFFCGGCGIRGYKFATHPGDPHDTSAGDITHASDPGARVVVPKKAKQ